MKKKIGIFSLLVYFANAEAQTITSDSFNLKKNEIGLNTAPVLRHLLTNGDASSTRYSLTYKRNLNKRSALRFSLVADLINNSKYDHHYSGNDKIILNSEGILVRQEIVSPNFISPHLNVGYERLFGKGKLRWFYGADLTFGYSENRVVKQNIALQKDSMQASQTWVENEYKPEIVSRTTIKTIAVGLTPFFGAKYPISKRFSISAQVGVDIVFRDQRISEKGFEANRKMHVSTFDFNQDAGFMNDISIIYKF
jgi:hypothetical protein